MSRNCDGRAAHLTRHQPHARPRITALANAILDPTPHTFLESMSGRRAQAED